MMNIKIGDPQKYEASVHYNGIILLTSYLQRLYVYETIQVKINGATNDRLNKVKGMFEHSEMMVKIFEETKSLMDGQRNKLKSFAGEVSLLMNNYIEEAIFYLNIAIDGDDAIAYERLGEIYTYNHHYKLELHQLF